VTHFFGGANSLPLQHVGIFEAPEASSLLEVRLIKRNLEPCRAARKDVRISRFEGPSALC